MDKIINTEKGLTLIERSLAIVEKYKIRTIFKAVFVVLIIAGTMGFIKNPTWIFEQYDKWKEKQHQEQLDIRAINNDKIQHIIEKGLYKINADRIMVLELHNGLAGLGGLPFSKCSATFEYLDDGVIPISSQYQDQQLSLIPFASRLFKDTYICGDISEVEEIDRGLYYRMMSNGTKHFAAAIVKGVDKPLAFIFVSFNHQIDNSHNCELVKEYIKDMSLDIALLLELNKRK